MGAISSTDLYKMRSCGSAPEVTDHVVIVIHCLSVSAGREQCYERAVEMMRFGLKIST